MPRSVDPSHARHWAELSLQGLTTAEIRKAHRGRTNKVVDPRTIERALEKTKSEIAERAASAAELQLGIREHTKQLMASIDPLTKAIRSTTSGKLNPLPMYAIATDHVTVGVSTADLKGASWDVRIPGEDSIELRLLKEHLPKDKAWKMLEKFSDSTTAWIVARIHFSTQIKRELNKVRLVLDISTSAEEPFELAGLTKIESAAATDRIEGGHNVYELLSTLVIDPARGGAWLGSTRVTSVRVPDIDQLRTAISDRVGAVIGSDKGRDVLTTWTAFTRAGSDLLDELAMLKMVTYLPGTCRSCKRFRLG